jgi:hypothetical protein
MSHLFSDDDEDAGFVAHANKAEKEFGASGDRKKRPASPEILATPTKKNVKSDRLRSDADGLDTPEKKIRKLDKNRTKVPDDETARNWRLLEGWFSYDDVMRFYGLIEPDNYWDYPLEVGCLRDSPVEKVNWVNDDLYHEYYWFGHMRWGLQDQPNVWLNQELQTFESDACYKTLRNTFPWAVRVVRLENELGHEPTTSEFYKMARDIVWAQDTFKIYDFTDAHGQYYGHCLHRQCRYGWQPSEYRYSLAQGPNYRGPWPIEWNKPCPEKPWWEAGTPLYSFPDRRPLWWVRNPAPKVDWSLSGGSHLERGDRSPCEKRDDPQVAGATGELDGQYSGGLEVRH